jgi:hypothetical protein
VSRRDNVPMTSSRTARIDRSVLATAAVASFAAGMVHATAAGNQADHDNLCFDPATSRLSGIFVDGACKPAGVHVQTAPMLHVWVTPNPCGSFAGTDARQMTGSCVTDSGLGV